MRGRYNWIWLLIVGGGVYYVFFYGKNSQDNGGSSSNGSSSSNGLDKPSGEDTIALSDSARERVPVAGNTSGYSTMDIPARRAVLTFR